MVFHWHDDAWSHIKSTFMSKGYRNILYSPLIQVKKEYRWDIMFRRENIPFFLRPDWKIKMKKMLKIVYQHRWSNILHVHRYITKMYIFGPYIPVRVYYWHYDFVWCFSIHSKKIIRYQMSVISDNVRLSQKCVIIMTNILSTDFSKHFCNGFFKPIQAIWNDFERFQAS